MSSKRVNKEHLDAEYRRRKGERKREFEECKKILIICRTLDIKCTENENVNQVKLQVLYHLQLL